jgi:hypothetical protein
MKKILLLAPVLSVVVSLAGAQNEKRPREEYTVKAGQNVNRAIPLRCQYQFPKFQDGYLFFHSGKKSLAEQLNYNMLLNKIIWINPVGDTMAIQSQDVRFIRVGAETFLYDKRKGYLRIEENSDSTLLASYKTLDIVRKESAGVDGYGGTSQTSATKSVLNVPRTNNQYIYNENTVFGPKEYYFLVDPKLKVKPASRSAFLKTFSSSEAIIRDYIEKENINFHSGDDVRKLFTYCVTQTKGKSPK